MKKPVVICMAIFCVAAVATGADAGNHTPAEWVSRLGADHLPERDEASAALLQLGSAARDAVHDALNSPDAETQQRARELWKTLRFMVVPDADAEIKSLVEESESGRTDREHWRAFVKKHGAQGIYLVAEFRVLKMKGCDQAQYAILEDADPVQVAQAITQSGDSRKALLATIENLPPDKAAKKTALNLIRIEMELGQNDKAFDFGHEAWLLLDDDDIKTQCETAAKKGNLADHVEQLANKTIAAEKDSRRLFKRLAFYVDLYAALDRKKDIPALCGLAGDVGGLEKRAEASYYLEPFIHSLLQTGGMDIALKILANTQTPIGLYMRSSTQAQMHSAEEAEKDWKAMWAALDASAKDRDEAYYNVGDLMFDWDDKRMDELFLKVLTVAAPDSVYATNACMRIAEYAENQKQYGKAADYYEKGMDCFSRSGGAFLSTDENDHDPEATIRKKIKDFRAMAEEKKSPAPEQTPNKS